MICPTYRCDLKEFQRVIDETYDILRAVKNHIRVEKGVCHFAYFAETFLAARNIMVYGNMRSITWKHQMQT